MNNLTAGQPLPSAGAHSIVENAGSLDAMSWLHLPSSNMYSAPAIVLALSVGVASSLVTIAIGWFWRMGWGRLRTGRIKRAEFWLAKIEKAATNPASLIAQMIVLSNICTYSSALLIVGVLHGLRHTGDLTELLAAGMAGLGLGVFALSFGELCDYRHVINSPIKAKALYEERIKRLTKKASPPGAPSATS